LSYIRESDGLEFAANGYRKLSGKSAILGCGRKDFEVLNQRNNSVPNDWASCTERARIKNK